MAEHLTEIFIVYIGGPMSMQVHTGVVKGEHGIVLRECDGSRYMRVTEIRLPCPERRVVTYAFADACDAIRLETFKVAACLSIMIQQSGDVMVAMARLSESQKSNAFAVSEVAVELYSLEFMETIARLEQSSRLVQRRKQKEALSEAFK